MLQTEMASDAANDDVDPELRKQIAVIAEEQGKFVAIKEYRQRTSKSLRRSRQDVEMILWENGIYSETPPRFRFPHYINWHLFALVGIPTIIGLLGATGLWMLKHYLFPDSP